MNFRLYWLIRLRRSAVRLALLLTLSVVGSRTVPCSAGERLATLCLPASKLTLHVAAPLPEQVRLPSSGAWQLVEADAPGAVIPAQVLPGIGPDGTPGSAGNRLVVVIPPRAGADKPRRFQLQPTDSPAAAPAFRFAELNNKSLQLLEGEQPVLVYNHGLITCERVPAGNHLRSRACYVHPLWGLSGEVLTDDFPKDHYHHHGIFWTWPHIQIDGREYNLWAGDNIKDQFVSWIGREAGPLAAVLAVENGWFVGGQKVMVERVWLRVFRASADSRAVDLDFTWIPVERPVTLWGAEGKSYGGLTMRFAPPSAKEAVITVPSGQTTEDLPDTKLPWADFTCKLAGQAAPSGAAIFVHPGHPDYPPTWLTRHYGPLCVGWPGVKPQTLLPGKPVRLSYRIWIHKQAVDVGQLKQAYEAYLAAVKAKWE